MKQMLSQMLHMNEALSQLEVLATFIKFKWPEGELMTFQKFQTETVTELFTGCGLRKFQTPKPNFTFVSDLSKVMRFLLINTFHLKSHLQFFLLLPFVYIKTCIILFALSKAHKQTLINILSIKNLVIIVGNVNNISINLPGQADTD